MAALALVGVGIHSYMQLDIEAYPNPVAPMIEVIGQPEGWSAEEVERYVTLAARNWPGWYARAGTRAFTVALRPGRRGSTTSAGTPATPWLSSAYSISSTSSPCLRGCSRSSRPGVPSASCIATGSRQGLHRGRAQDRRGLDSGEAIPSGPGRYRRGGVRRPDQAVSRGRGSFSSARPQCQPGAAAVRHRPTRIRTWADSVSPWASSLRRARHRADSLGAPTSRTSPLPHRRRAVSCARRGRGTRGCGSSAGHCGRDGEPDIVEGIVLMRYGGDSLSTVKGIHDRVDHIRRTPDFAAGHGHRDAVRPG